MNLKRPISAALALALSVVVLACNDQPAVAQPPPKVIVLQPARDGAPVGEGGLVSGTAKLGPGEHLWVLLHRTRGFERVWWPQDSAEPDAATGEWSVSVTYGQDRDVGYEFDIAIIIVGEAEHRALEEHRFDAMKRGEFRPIPMPETMAVPLFRKVLKTQNS